MNDTMENHACYVWKNFVENSGFDKILVIAHSAGGKCLKQIQKSFPKTFYNQVTKIALTDSFVMPHNEITK